MEKNTYEYDNKYDEKENRVIELLTPKHLTCDIELVKQRAKNRRKRFLTRIAGIAAMLAVVAIISYTLSSTKANAAQSSPEQILARAIESLKQVRSCDLMFDARIASATTDHLECTPWHNIAKLRYRLLKRLHDEGYIQRVDMDWDSIKVSNIYINDSVFMWKNGELLHEGTMKSPNGIKSTLQLEDIFKKFMNVKNIEIITLKGDSTLVSHRIDTCVQEIGNFSIIQKGIFDNTTGHAVHYRNSFSYSQGDSLINIDMILSRSMQYNIPMTEQEITNIK